MTRVTYVIPSLSIGGTEWQLVHLIQGLAKDHEILVICTRHDGALGGDVRRSGAFVRVLGNRFGGWNFRIGPQVAHILHGFRPDIVHLHMSGFDLWPARAARRMGVPVVVSSRRELATWKKWRHLWLQRKANALVDCIVANSHAAADFAIEQEHAPKELFRVIPNGIDADAFVAQAVSLHLRYRYKIPADRRVIGTVANFSSVKDYPLFVNMAETLLGRRKDLHFLMVGGGADVSSIERLIEKRGLADHFTRVTTVSERADLYALMDVFVLCSKVEGFSNALIEAMAAGKPVAATAAGGMLEAIVDGETGRLVAPHTPAAFAEAVTWLLDHPAEARRMGTNAAAHVRKELPMERMVARYRALYAELLANASRKGR